MVIDIKELLADYAHKSWSGWMQYLFSKSTLAEDGTVVIPRNLVERWLRQSNTKYKDLPESEKKSDLEEADKMIFVFAGHLRKKRLLDMETPDA